MLWKGIGGLEEKIRVAIREVKEVFPFKGYMDGKESKYLHLIKIVLREVPSGSKILDCGCGPCDLTAILARLGYVMVGVDDLRDPWHLIGDNIRRIKDFAKELGITLIIEPIEKVQLNQNSFDAVLMVDILEHHLTPRILFNRALSLLKPKRLLLIETPNAAMLAKRLLLLLGKSNYQDVNFLFYNVGTYRYHVREYTVQEVNKVLRLIGLNHVKVETSNHGIHEIVMEARGFKRFIARTYTLLSNIYPSFRSTIIAYGRKPEDWKPITDLEAFKSLKNIYPHLVKYNLDGESDEEMVERLSKGG